MNTTKTAFTFANNQSESFTQICSEIREKIDILNDHNFEDFEQDMYNLSIVFYNMWSPYINFEENRMSVTIDKTRFVNEIRLLYNTFYLVYGNKRMMDEIEQMLQEEPDSINDVNEYLEFVETLRSFENYRNYARWHEALHTPRQENGQGISFQIATGNVSCWAFVKNTNTKERGEQNDRHVVSWWGPRR